MSDIIKSIGSCQRTSQLGHRKIWAFFGTDFTLAGESAFKEAYAQGYTLLPLNTAAIGQAHKAGLPFTLMEDWLGRDVVFLKRRKMHPARTNDWFCSATEEFTTNGICWPKFDQEAMHHFWSNVIYAYDFAKKVIDVGIQDLRYFLPKMPRPGLYYYRSDVHSILWKALLSDRAHPFELPLGKDEYHIFSLPSIVFKSDTNAVVPSPLSIIRDKIVLAINIFEVHRFRPAIRDLLNRFPNNIAIVTLSPVPNMAKKISTEYEIPVICPMPVLPTQFKVAEQFLRGYRVSVSAAKGKELEDYLKYLGYHFEYYCQHRWPALDFTFKSWTELWSQNRPKAVIGSILQDAESQLPIEAARNLKIPTFSMPHGAYGLMPNTVASDYYLCNVEEQRIPITKAGVAPERIRLCGSMLAENEYPVLPKASSVPSGWRLLIITSLVGFPDCIYPVISTRAQIEAFRVLDKPPEDLAKRLMLSVKPHPGYPDNALFSVVSGKFKKQVLPKDADLISILKETDLVVAVNCKTSAIMHVLRLKMPIVFFCTDQNVIERIIDSAREWFQDSAREWFQGGKLVTNGEEFWNTVRRFFLEPEFREVLKSKSQSFAQKNLDNSNYPSIGEVVDDVLSTLSSKSPESVSKKRRSIQTNEINQLLPDYASIPVNLSDVVCDYGEMPLEELEVICKIVRNRQPGTVFEIGTFMGKTTLCLAANSSARIYTLDLPPKGNENYAPPEMNDPVIDVYPENPGAKFFDTTYATRITQLYGDSQSFDFCPYFGKMDAVIVDACHHYDFVLRDSMNAFKMIKPDGIIIWHGYADNAPGVMKALGLVSQKFPLSHISGTSLVVYMRKQELTARPETHGNKDTSQTPVSLSDLNKLTSSSGIRSSEEMEQVSEKPLFEPLRVLHPDNSDLTVTLGPPCKAAQQDKMCESASVRLSVIIPTFNRAEFLSQTIESVLEQTISPSEYEIIVVDNNSSDNTKSVIENLNRKHGNRIRYVFEAESGLVYGRHTGAREARGEILVFADDDIIASEGWITAIKETFSDAGVSLVGGKNIPRYEVEPPEWIDAFWSKNELGTWNIYISLLDLGEKQIEIPANFVFGCNFSIRKNVLYECGGFHPDVVPRELIRYLGDGEYGLALAFMKKGYKAVYNPAASIEHLVPKGRMNVEYFCRRAFGEGVTNSYTQIREKGTAPDDMVHDPESIDKTNQFANAVMYGGLNADATSTREIQEVVRYSYRQGGLYHQNQVRNDPGLLSYVLQKDYYTTEIPSVKGNKKIEKAKSVSDKSLHLEEKDLSSVEIIS